MSKKNRGSNQSSKTSLTLRQISPKSLTQESAFLQYEEGSNLLLHGLPGTGKTFIGMYLALKELEDSRSDIEKLIIIRSAVQSRNVGFMPGSEKEKMAYYEAPYKAIASELYGRDDAYEVLKIKKKIEFMSTSFIRGLSFNRSIILVDEVQNMAFNELHAIMTRVGEDSRIILSGDLGQDDLTSERYSEKTGLNKIIEILDNMRSNLISKIEFLPQDIVRSEFVKDYIISLYRYKEGLQVP